MDYPNCEQFEASDEGEKFRLLNASLFSNKKLLHFVAFVQNKISSSATLFLSDHAVMLHNLATKNEFKGRGIATEITLYMMNFAKSLGYKHCYLDSSEQAFALYKRMGFHVYGISKIYKLNEGY